MEEGILDLDIYIQRRPSSSLAHTKRGVRKMWRGDFDGARADLERAVHLNPNNAEAHDDLGVIKDSLLLKSVILEAQGQHAEATALREEAEFQPEGTWHEGVGLQ